MKQKVKTGMVAAVLLLCIAAVSMRYKWINEKYEKPENIERTAQKWFSRSLEKIGGKKYEKYDEKSSTECKGSCRKSRDVNEGYQG